MSYYWAHGTVAKYGRKWKRMRCDKCVTKSWRSGNYCTNKEIMESQHEKRGEGIIGTEQTYDKSMWKGKW